MAPYSAFSYLHEISLRVSMKFVLCFSNQLAMSFTFFYLIGETGRRKERQTGREKCHPLIRSSNVCHSWAGPGPCQEPGIQSRSPMLLFSTLPGCVLAGSWNQKWSWDSNPGTTIWDMGVLSGFSTAVPNAHPCYITFPNEQFSVLIM